MRKAILIISILLFVNIKASALMRMGPPVSELNINEGSLSFDYTYTKEDYEEDDGYIWEDNKTHLFFTKIGIGIEDDSEIFLRLGGNYIEDMKTGPAWGAGIKAKVAEKDRLKIGALFQTTGIYNEKHFYDFYAYDFQIGVGPCIDLNDISLYAFPFLHFVTGSVGFTDIKQTSEFGGCAGILFKPSKNINLNIEGQFLEDSYSVSAGLIFKFGSKSPETKKRNPYIDETGRKIRGWRATIDNQGKPVTTPVYEDEK